MSIESPFGDIHEIKEISGMIEKMIEELPEDEQDFWHEQLDVVEGSLSKLKLLRSKLLERAKASSPEDDIIMMISNFLIDGLIDPKEVPGIQEFFANILGNKEREVARGSTAIVAFSIDEKGEPSSECYKIIYSQEQYSQHLTLEREKRVMEELSNLNVDGVRIPIVGAVIIDRKKGLAMITMERINGRSLEQVLADGKLPEGFQIDDFFDKLKKFIIAMHAMGIHHRDLHEGNVMIDFNTLLPVVIDFGLSSKFYETDGKSTAYREKDNLTGRIKDYLDDLERVEHHRQTFKEKFANIK